MHTHWTEYPGDEHKTDAIGTLWSKEAECETSTDKWYDDSEEHNFIRYDKLQLMMGGRTKNES
jgi:hypothetical protein